MAVRPPVSALPGSASATAIRSGRLFLAALLCCTAMACKVIVIVPEGGKVVSEDGFECLGGQTCEIDVSDTTFDSTFTAIPDEGNTFSRWKRADRYFCGGSTQPCPLNATGFGGDQNLLDVLASDQEFYIEPIFVDYNVGYWRNTIAQIDKGTFSTDGYLYASQPIIGQCDPGAIKPEPKSRARKALNETRALHNLPDADYAGQFDTDVQESSLVQRANNYLSHFPSPGDNCYSPAAEDAASTSNLSGGSVQTDPAEDVFGWTNDNNNLAALMEAGHRRWMLFPQLGYTSYGQVDGYATLKVFDFGIQPMNPVSPDLEFVAMPYRNYPYILVSGQPKPTPWSLSMVPGGTMSSAFDYFANATITVKETDTGKQLNISNRHTDNKGFGLANFLSWMVNGWDYDVNYTVTIRNIRMPNGSTRTVEYPVMLDRYNLFPVNHPLENTDSAQDGTFQGRFNSQNDKDSYPLVMSGSVSVSGQSEFSNWGFYVLVYDADKKLVASGDAPFSGNFPFGRYTFVISHCDDNGLCYQGTQNYTVSVN